MRTLFFVALAAAAALLGNASGQPPAAPKPLTAEQKDKLKERDKAEAETNELGAKGDWKGAIAAAERMLAIEQQVFGENHADVARSWRSLASLHELDGNLPAAQAAADRRAKAAAAVYGPEHWEAVDARLGATYLRNRAGMSEADRAQLDVAGRKYNQAERLSRQGQFAAAKQLLDDSLATRRKLLPPDHASMADNQFGLADVAGKQARYEVAEPLMKDALRIRRKTLGPDHPDTAGCLNALALMYSDQGRYADAEPLLIDAVRIRRAALGTGNTTTAASLSDLAMVCEALGKFTDAELLYQEALQIVRRAVGPDHWITADCLNNFAGLYVNMGRTPDARPMFEDALRIRRAALGPDHHLNSSLMTNLAGVYAAEDRHADAEKLYKDALRLLRARFPAGHPLVTVTVSELSELYRRQGRFSDAEPLARTVAAATADQLDRTAVIQTEAAQLAYAASTRLLVMRLVACTLKADPTSTYAAVLRWRGAVTARQTFGRAARGVDPASQKLLADLTNATRQLATLSGNPPPPEAKVDVPARMKELTDRRDDLEAKLSARSATFDKYVKNRSLTPADLQKCLPDGTALVDYVEYHGKLAAFVVTKDAVRRVELGDAKPVAEAADAFLLTMSRPRPTTGKLGDPAVALRKLVWEPVAGHLGGAKVVLVCPDGPLCRVPFAVLPGTDPSKYLLEEVALAVVPVPRLLPELLADRGPRGDAPPTLLAVGNVNFDAEPAVIAAAPAAPAAWVQRAGGARKWGRLPGTAGEVDDLAAAFRGSVPGGKPTVLRDNEATEAAVRDGAGRHDYLHLATHGFFAAPSAKPPGASKGGLVGDLGFARPAGPHPGLLSGLALAGANEPRGDDDGVLTALEVGDLDLAKVELAVLSACETGLGEVAGGEGVLGLQRAFQVAGARTTVTTLWQIPDAATRVLMGRFYANLWDRKMGRLAALREAQLWMLNEGAVGHDPKRGAVADDAGAPPAPVGGRRPPFYWAAFTLAGDWR